MACRSFARTEARQADAGTQTGVAFDVGSQSLATGNQQYELTALIDSLRQEPSTWRALLKANWRLRAASP